METTTSPATRQGLAAEIVTTGTEILLGEIVDTNAAWIAQQLRDAGVNLYFKTTVGDNEARVRGVIELGMSRSDVIIVSGGLGPTVDDITRQAIAAATGRQLILHEGALETLKARFARFGAVMTENNLQQALIPDGAAIIPNPVGTAPGFIVETDRSTVIALPGVPREMKHLMTETVLPYLRQRSGDTGIIRRRVFRTMGIGESRIDSELADLMHGSNPTIGLAAHTAQADIRITARAATAAAADTLLDALENEIRLRIGQYIYSATPEEPYEAVVARSLQEAGAQIALLESNTAGAVAARLDAVAGPYALVTAHWQVGGELPPGVGEQMNGVNADRFSDELARRVAEAVRATSGATFGVVELGTSGADEGVYGQKSGQTWLALAGPAGVVSQHLAVGGSDEYSVVRIGNQLLGLLWDQVRNTR